MELKHTRYILLILQFFIVTLSSFQIIKHSPPVQSVDVGSRVTLVCQTDSYYEYCDWIHKPNDRSTGDRECHFEWKRDFDRVLQQKCDASLSHRVTITGNYNKHQCGIIIDNVDTRDAGQWACKVEKYRWGLGKGVGTTVQYALKLNVNVPTTTTTTTTSTTTTATPEDVSLTDSPNVHKNASSVLTPEPEYLASEETDDSEPFEDIIPTTIENLEEEKSEDLSYRIDDTSFRNTTELEDSFLLVEEMVEEETDISGVLGAVFGVVLAVVALVGIVVGALVWRRKQTSVEVVTMSKILEDSEARGHILEEAEYNSNVFT